MVRTRGASSSTGGQHTDGNAAASSSAGHKRAREPEIDDDCSCALCFEVLLDPVTLACGHALDQRCMQRVVAEGNGLCPSCREPLPAVLPNVNVQFRNVVQRQYPQQVAPPPSGLETLSGAGAGAWWAGWSDLVVWCC
jgi:hypothetical protein